MKKIISFLLMAILLTGCSIRVNDEKSPLSGGTPERAEDSHVLNVALPGAAEFQPHSVQEESARHALEFVYEPLFHINSEATAVPVLAERVNNRGTEVDIYLRPGIKWHDGSEFTAFDVVYTINLITGGKSVYSTDIMAGAKVRDNRSVTVYFTRCMANPESIFTFPIVKNGSPLSMKTSLGTGPYKYTGKEGYDTYVFEPLETRKFSKLRMINLRSREAEEDLFQSGETDILYVDNNRLMSYAPRANSKEYKYPTNHMIYIGFNAARVPEEVRRGINYATDRSSLTKKVFLETVQPVVVPQIPGKSSTYVNDYNLPAAEREMKMAGYVFENGYYQKGDTPFTLDVIVQPGGKHPELANELAKNLDNFGIKCDIKDSQSFYACLSEGDYDIAVGTWNNAGDLWSMLKPGNFLFYSSDRLLRVYSDFHTRTDFNNVLITEMPVIPVAFRCDAVFLSTKISQDLDLSYSMPFKGIGDILN